MPVLNTKNNNQDAEVGIMIDGDRAEGTDLPPIYSTVFTSLYRKRAS